MAVKHIWHGTLSFGAALVTFVICAVPAWFTFRSIRLGAAPEWAYIGVGGLALIGGLLTFAFLRKAWGGVSPSRDRRVR